MQKMITRKLELFGHICRMENDRKIKSVVFGRLKGTNKRGRPHKEWMDNITEWCGVSIQELYHAALEKQKCRRITRMASGIGPLVNDDDDDDRVVDQMLSQEPDLDSVSTWQL